MPTHSHSNSNEITISPKHKILEYLEANSECSRSRLEMWHMQVAGILGTSGMGQRLYMAQTLSLHVAQKEVHIHMNADQIYYC